MDKVWMKKVDGEPQEVDATPEVLVPMMNSGWSQCPAPVNEEEIHGDHS